MPAHLAVDAVGVALQPPQPPHSPQPPQPPFEIFDPMAWDMAAMNAWLVGEGFTKEARTALLRKFHSGDALFALTEQGLKDSVGGPFEVIGTRKRLLKARKMLMEDAWRRATPHAANGGMLVLDVFGTIEDGNDVLRRLRGTAAFAQSKAAAAQHEWVKRGNAQPWQTAGHRKIAGVSGTTAVVLEGIFNFVPGVPPLVTWWCCYL